MAGRYEAAPTNDHDYVPTHSHSDIAAESGGYGKKRTSPWIKFGVPVLILVVIGAVLGGVLGTQLNKDDASTSNNGGGNNGPLSPEQSSSAAASLSSARAAIGRFATATDAFGLPVYPSTTNTAAFVAPTLVNGAASWPAETFKPSNPSVNSVRPDRPRLLAPAYKWAALPSLIAQDPYLKGWNDTIIGNASSVLNAAPKAYYSDGSSGALDIAREVKERVKNLAYAYRVTNNTAFAERVWRELANAMSDSFGPSGDNWNSGHFLDVGEFTAAFAIGYDWLYSYWSSDRRGQLRNAIVKYGLNYGVNAYTDANSGYGWWRSVNGNWNCVCNSGLTMGALAILNDDTSGQAAKILGLTVDNARDNCAQGPSADGTWSETANYWYFGTTGHAEMTSSLISATGSDYGLLSSNKAFNQTALYHIYVTGMTSLFNYGDHGPNKFSTTANSMMFYGSQYKAPVYSLFQRDRIDASEPFGLFWYDPSVNGAWWDNLPLDHYFSDRTDQWASMRSSWTDNNGLYVAIKAGTNSGHQTHNDLDGGDFVFDAMGQRWAGELGSGDYNAPGYFVGDDADSPRWTYYRKRTEGQNTLVLNRQNQELAAFPTTKFDSSKTQQGSSTVLDIPNDSTAFFTADLTNTYGGTSIKRGIRLLNGRKQILLQDDISNAGSAIQWRMHTNASVAIDTSKTSATLTLGGKTLKVQLLNPPSGVTFDTADPVRYDSDPALPNGASDQENPGVTVLIMDVPSGSHSLQVLFNPQWDGMDQSRFVTPKSVSVDNWSLTSHN